MLTKVWNRGQEGWPRSFPVIQFPNPPLLIALVARLAAAFFTGTPAEILLAVFVVTLGVWAWLELFEGVNWFRRVLGAAGLVLAVWSAIGSL